MPSRSQTRAEAIIALIGEDGITELTKRVTEDLDDIAKKGARASEATEGISDSLLGAKERMALYATGLNAAVELTTRLADLTKQAFESIGDGAQLQALQRRYDQQVAGSSRRLVEFREAVAGAVSDDVLRRYALLADTAGITGKQTAEVFNVAARLSASGFGDVAAIAEELFDSIIGATDSNLEKFGIVFDLPEATKAYAAEMGIAASAIDKAVESQAALRFITDDVAKRFADVKISDNAYLNAQRLKTEMENLDAVLARKKSEAWVAAAQVFGILPESGGVRANRQFDRINGLIQQLLAVDDAQTRVGRSAVLTAQVQANQRGVIADLTKMVTANDEALSAALGVLNKEAEARAEGIKGLVSEAQYREELDRITREMTDAVGLSAMKLEREERARKAVAKAMQLQRDELIRLQSQQALAAVKALPRGGARDKNDLDAMLAEGYAEIQRLNQEAPLDKISTGKSRRGGGVRRRRRGPAEPTPRRGADPMTERRQGRRGIEDGPTSFDQEVAGNKAIAASLDVLGQSAINLGSAFDQGLMSAAAASASLASTLSEHVNNITAKMGELKEAGLDSSQAFIGSVPGMLAAGGQLAAGFASDERGKAGLMAAVEAAAAVASFATYDYVGGAMHLLSAGMYAAVAGGAGGSGSAAGAGGSAAAAGSSRRPPPPRMPATGINEAERRGTFNLTMNFTGGVIGTNKRMLENDLAPIISNAVKLIPPGYRPA